MQTNNDDAKIQRLREALAEATPMPAPPLAPMSPMAFLSTFIMAYSQSCIHTDTRTVEMFYMVESAKDAIYKEALKRGRDEGYAQAMCEMQATLEQNEDFMQKLKS